MTIQDALRALFEEYYLDEHIEMVRDRPRRRYDELQIGAAHLCWTCCHREVFATHPASGCIVCRKAGK